MHRRVACLLVVAGVLGGIWASRAQPGRSVGLTLLTSQDAEVLGLTEAEWEGMARPKGDGLGPRIVVQAPEVRESPQGPTLEARTPMDLTLVFEARGPAVDMPSLRVQARKGIFSKSLTELLQPYIRGTRVEVREVKVPEGRFLIQIDIADVQGAKASETYRLEVKGR